MTDEQFDALVARMDAGEADMADLRRGLAAVNDKCDRRDKAIQRAVANLELAYHETTKALANLRQTVADDIEDG